MFKNIAGQFISVQMIALDGSAFTGAVTVYITGDNGTQTLGSVGSGVCAHKGNGCHSYAPSQAETNYRHIAMTFIGTGAVPVTLNVYPQDLAMASIQAFGTLSGTPDATTADLGANAPSFDTSNMTLYIPSKGFARIINNYNTSTGVAEFDSTSVTLEDGDYWVLIATAGASAANPPGVQTLSISPSAVQSILTEVMVESYAEDAAAPSLSQAIMLIQQVLTDAVITGTNLAIKRLDGTTNAAVLTLDDAENPSSVTRTS